MPTTVTSIDARAREQLADRYVELSALEMFFEGIMRQVRLLSSSGFTQPEGDSWPDSLDELIEELAALHGRLWPDEIIPGRTDYESVVSRSVVAATRLFVNAAGHPDVFAAEADALITKVAR